MELYGYEIQREKDLSHHGILGMKWGVRRYQNPDGTLTNAGKHHLKIKKEKTLTREEKKQIRKTREEVFLNEYKNGSRPILDYKDQGRKACIKIQEEYGDEAVKYIKNWERNVAIGSATLLALNLLNNHYVRSLLKVKV